jgi:glycerophosphoryl diester phosphodiesterase
MKLIARLGNRLHAPEQSRIALTSAWTAGADAIELAVTSTRDGHLVVAAGVARSGRTGAPIRIETLSLEELLRDFDASAAFPDGGGYRYRDTERFPGRRMSYELFPEILDEIPSKAELLVHLSDYPVLAQEHMRQVIDELAKRGRLRTTILFLCSPEPELLASARTTPSRPRTCLTGNQLPGRQILSELSAARADGVLVGDDFVFANDGTLTPLATALTRVVENDRSLCLRLRQGAR